MQTLQQYSKRGNVCEVRIFPRHMSEIPFYLRFPVFIKSESYINVIYVLYLYSNQKYNFNFQLVHESSGINYKHITFSIPPHRINTSRLTSPHTNVRKRRLNVKFKRETIPLLGMEKSSPKLPLKNLISVRETTDMF